MKRFFIRFGGELQAAFIFNRRYWLETAATWVGYIVIFAAVFLGIRVGGLGAGSSEWGQEAAIRYAIWVLCLHTVVGLPQLVQEEAMTGVLEQRFLVPNGGVSSLIMYHIGRFLVWLFGTTLLSFAVLVIAPTPIHFNAGIVPVVLLILVGIEGLGLLLAGLALFFKRIGAVTQLVQMALLGLALLPVDNLSKAWQALFQVLPLSAGLPLLNNLLLGRTSFLLAVRYPDFWVLFVSSTVWLIIGLASLRWMVRLVKRRGLLGRY